MRKRFRSKHHSCPLCKPNKTGHAYRWNNKELNMLKIWEKEKVSVLKS